MTDGGADSPSIRRQVSEGVRWTALQTFGTQALQFVIFAVLARLLSPAEFGLIGIATIFVSFSEVFAGWAGLSSGLVQRTNLDKADLDTAFWVALGVTSVFSTALFASAGLIGDLFSEPDVVPVVKVMAGIPLIGAFAVVPSATLSRDLRFKSLSIRSLAGVLAGGVVGWVMAATGYGVWAIVGQQIASRAVGTLTVLVASPWRPSMRFSRESSRWLVPFSLSIIGRDIVGVVSRRADNFVIGYYLGASALGVYRVGYRVYLVATEVFVRTTSRLALPTLSRVKETRDRLHRAYYTAVRLTALIGVPAFLGIAVLSNEIVLTFFGSQWEEAGPVLALLAAGGVVQTFSFFDHSILIAVGRPGPVVNMAILNTLLNVVGFVIAVRWGIAAVALAYSIRAMVTAPIWLYVTRRYTGTKPTLVLKQLAWPLLTGMAMVALILGLKATWLNAMSAIPTLGIGVVVGATFYGALAWLTQRSTVKEGISLIRAGAGRAQ